MNNFNNRININAKVIDTDKNNQSLSVLFNNLIYKVSLNVFFIDSFNQIDELLHANNTVIRKNDINISLLNIIINENKIEFNNSLNSLVILEPSWLINVSSLAQFDFCERSLFNNRFSIQSQNEYMLMGSIIHEVFEEIINGISKSESKSILFNSLQKKLEKSILLKVFDLAISDIDLGKITLIIKEHLNSLYLYIKNQKIFRKSKIATEHYIIDPSLGMKGKIDSVVFNGQNIMAIELKTGKSWGGKAKPGHAFQAQAYSLLLENKHKSKSIENPMIIYSGDYQYYNQKIYHPVDLGMKVDFDYKTKTHVINLRNRVIVADYLFKLEYERKNKKKCDKCFQLSSCKTLYHLDSQDNKNNIPLYDIGINKFNPAEIEFFKKNNQYLTEECSTIKSQIGQYFMQDIKNRVNLGKCIEIDEIIYVRNNIIKALCDNRSELRERDRCLISDEKGPVAGECLEAVVYSLTDNTVKLKVKKDLKFDPKWIDSLNSEIMFERNYPSLVQFIQSKNLVRLNKILIEGHNPKENNLGKFEDIDTGVKLNEAQKKAISYALEVNDFLLIQGPPGTGKTLTIAKIVQQLYNKGKKIILSCFTHRAIDELIRKLNTYAPEVEFYRIGRFEEESINKNNIEKSSMDSNNINIEIQNIKNIIKQDPIYIGTTQAWLSGRYDKLIGDKLYDIAIIDEASQIILPNSIGVIRLVKSFILVGDHVQQPPVIQSKFAKKLSRTLFQALFENQDFHNSTKVMLDTQHRMNPVIGNFISNNFYNKKLKNSNILNKNEKYLDIDNSSLMGKICDPEDIITLVDVKDHHCQQNSKSVEEDSEVILDIVEFLIKNKINPKKIGVIAPYRAQVALIRRKVDNFISNNQLEFSTNEMIDTIDRFQGDERDIIIFSISLSKNIAGDLLKDERKINVALSRAKKKLIVVGDWDLANQKYKDFKALYDYVSNNGSSKFIKI